MNIRFIRLSACILLAGCIAGCDKKVSATPPPVTPPADIVVGLKNKLPSLLKESSGLCLTDGALWSFGDSGNPNSIYRIDSATGAILQVVTITNYPNVDWEDMAADSMYIYVGDTGNNNGDRTDLKILRIKKADIPPAEQQVNVVAEAINFSYADQSDLSSNSNTNFDCESLVSIGDNLYIFSKDRGDFQTRCYKLPKAPGTYKVSPIATFNVDGKVTDATYNPVTKELALLGYMDKKLDSFIWFFNNYTEDNFFNGASKRYTIGNVKTDWQTEGLTYVNDKRLLLSCESSTSTAASLYFVQKP
ncbi:MAG TPA: hypothetical protein VG738_00565 [Chitinophagaceae bacterium]|nr:hypothetical protein [Chitinophagaceae bacterium]